MISGPLRCLDPLPLACYIRARRCRGVAEHVGVAANDLPGNGRLHVGEVEDPGFSGKLGVEDHLEQEVAEFLRQRRRCSRLEGVVDLIRLLEEMLAQRFVGLLAVPWAAVGAAESLADVGHGPRTGGREFRRDRSHEQRLAQVVGAEFADRGRWTARPANEVVERIEPGQNRERIAAPGPMPTGQIFDVGRRRCTENRGRNDQDRS